jgi:hypothetical protein
VGPGAAAPRPATAAALAAHQAEADRIASEKAAAAHAAEVDAWAEQQAEAARREREADTQKEAASSAAPTVTLDAVVAAALPDSFAEVFPAAPAVETGPRLTLGQINERLAPISLSVDCLSQLGFDPVERVKASRLYLESDLPAIARAIARHVIDATS